MTTTIPLRRPGALILCRRPRQFYQRIRAAVTRLLAPSGKFCATPLPTAYNIPSYKKSPPQPVPDAPSQARR